MFEIIGYWLSTTLLVAPIWVSLSLWVFTYLDEVYYNVEGNRTHLPFFQKVSDLFDYEPLFWTGVVATVISGIFTFFAILVGLKMGLGLVGGVITFSHTLSTLLSVPMSWVAYAAVIIFGLRAAVQFAAKFAVMRKKIDQLNK